MASQSSKSEPNVPYAEHVPSTQRRRYGTNTMEVLATSNSSDSCLFDYFKSGQTFPEPKKVFTVRNPDFEHLYETKILGAIVKILKSSLPKACTWALNVFRLGFYENQTANPIVVHLLVARDYLSDEGACSLVKEIGGAIRAAQWEGETVYVDVCQRIPNLTKLRSTDNCDNAIDLSESFSELYSYIPPLPGFSIGPKDRPSCAGSFSGFIEHTNEINGTKEIFGLTCEHVLNSAEAKLLGSSDEYRYKGGKKFIVTMPAMSDHEETLREISKRRQTAKQETETALRQKDEEQNQSQGLNSSTRRHSAEFTLAAIFEKHWEEAEQQAKAHKIEVGHVYATSGRDTSRQFYDGCLDWGIFTSPFPDAKNKHVEYSRFDQSSRFHLDQTARRFVASCLGDDFIEKFKAYLDGGPDFKAFRETNPDPDEIFFKVASRSSGWREAQYNGIRATISDGSNHETREWCFVTCGSFNQVSISADSGAPIIDSNYQPTALLWGGEEHGQGGFKDTTYATPIHEILKDIERRMGWQKGSVTFC